LRGGISLVALHRRMQAVFLQLVDVMLGLFHALASQDALALLVHLQHVKFRLLARPSENKLKHVSDVIHIVHRVIPADDQVAGLQCGLRLVLHFLDPSRQQFRGCGLNHGRKVKEGRPFVEQVGKSKLGFCLPVLQAEITRDSYMACSDLKGKSLVVIGGTTGLGLSAARAFVEHGAQIVVVGRNPKNVKAAQKELGETARSLAADAIDPKTAARAIRLAAREFGGFHGLYHVAGGSGRQMGDGPLHELTDEGWRSTIDLNLSSLAFSNRAAIRQFLAQGTGGSILNMGSVLGWSPSPRFFATHAYAAAKSAVIGFSKSIAAYYANKNIRCNVLAPGLVETPMAQRAA
jgi:NAD(P)-dependent dehydrogenase (short-subunit alcohol dehydrogenase family)